MNVLFCHDGPINCDEKNRYYSIGFNDDLMFRYSEVFGNVGIITRVNRENLKTTYSEADKLSDDKHVVVEYPNYLTLRGVFLNKSASTKKIEDAIAKSDALIIRLPSFLGSKCLEIAKKYQKPYLVEVVGCSWDALWNHSLAGKILAPYMYLKTKKQVKNATDVLYVTSEFLQGRYPTSGRQVVCSDVELKEDNLSSDLPEVIRGNNKKIIIGTIGKIDLKYKGQSTVIESIKQLKVLGYDVKYQVVGPGNKEYLEKIAIKNGVEDSVEFVGSMSHDKVFEWLDTIDLYIQPSLTEGMPRALIEAMSRGCPCIASNAGGMPELLDEKYIFEKGKSKQLTTIISNHEKNDLFNQGINNREFTKQFLPNVIKEKRRAFYQEFKKILKRSKNNEQKKNNI